MQTDSAKALVEHGADVNVKASDGCTELMLAASAVDSEIIRDLLSKALMYRGDSLAGTKH